MFHNSSSTHRIHLLLLLLLLATATATATATAAPTRTRGAGRAAPSSAAAGVYPQFRGPGGVSIRWVADQMPLKVYVSPGTSLDSIMDPATGISATSVDDRDHWPDLVAGLVQNLDQLRSLPVADGYSPEQYQAAIQGISSWKNYGSGLYSYQFTEHPGDADIYVFWTAHFIDKHGFGMLQNDIRGYTAKRSFPYKAILSGRLADFKPVVTLLRTTGASGNPMPPERLRASAAHEFGHALGIEGHSTNPNDLMSVYYGHGVISGNDAATIRYLYHSAPDYIP